MPSVNGDHSHCPHRVAAVRIKRDHGSERHRAVRTLKHIAPVCAVWCSCERVPAQIAPTNAVSCRDKSVALCVPSHQKYVHFWPRARLPNSPEGWGWGSSNLWTKVVILSVTIRPHEGKRPPLSVGDMPPLSDWGLSKDKTVLCHTGHSPGAETTSPSPLLSLRTAERMCH